jgi:acyl-CoA thioester hydrolase
VTAPHPTRRLGPPPASHLAATTTTRVRFHEVDSMGIVWHGHYLTYFEEGRCAFGRRYGFDYSDFFAHDLHAPLVHAEIDHFAPARFGDVLRVTARLHIDDSARIDFTYRIVEDQHDRLLVTGRTVQVFTTPTGALCLARPPFLAEFVARWRGEISTLAAD